MDKDTLIKIGNLIVRIMTPIVEAEREKAAEVKARAHAAEADFRRTHCQFCYEPRGELDLEVAHRVVCARCLHHCARALLERQAKLRDQQRELGGLIAQLGDVFSRECAPAAVNLNLGDNATKARPPSAGSTFRDICEELLGLANATGSPHAPKHAAVESEPAVGPRVVAADTDPLARAKVVSDRLDVMERLIRFEDVLTGRRPPRESA